MDRLSQVPDDVVEIAGGYWVPKGGIHCPQWQRETQRLDHDQFLPTYCAQFIPAGGCAVDGGALNGDHSIVYSRKAGASGLLFAIEPGELAFKCLAHNVALFPEQNTLAVNCALGEIEGSCEHIVHASDLGMSTTESSVTGNIRVLPLDTIIKAGFPDGKDRKVDFIKLDLEGAELSALKGAQRILAVDRPVLVIEINQYALQNYHAGYVDIISFLHAAGYRSRQVDGQREDALLWDEVCWPAEMGLHPRCPESPR